MTNKNHALSVDTGGDDEIDLGRLVGTLIDNRWIIIALTTLITAAGLVYAIMATPIYSADALIQVEQNVGNSILSDLSQILPTGNQPQSAAEIEILQSRMVIGKTVNELHLENSIKEKYLPIVGQGFQRIFGENPGEVTIAQLEVPDSMLGSPMELTIKDKKNYELSYDGNVIIYGKKGEIERSTDGVLLQLNDIEANPNTKFIITKKSILSVIENIRNNLSVSDKGKDTGVLSLSLMGDNPKEIRDILISISNNYVTQNIERKSEEAAKSLDFLKIQLPQVRAALDSAEGRLNDFRQSNDSVDLSLEAKSVLDTLVATETQLNQLTFQEAEISKLYTKEHPAYRALLEKRETLEQEKDKINKSISRMPKVQQEILKLTRDVTVNQDVYMQLLNKQQELSVSKASTVGNVRIIDPAATEPKPVKPQKGLVIILSIVAGLVISIVYILIKTLLHRGIESAEELENLGINVYANVPISEWQVKKDLSENNNSKNRRAKELLTTGNPTDLAIEAIRGLRTSMHFAMIDAENNIVMISGVSPSIGKTFISANLAAVIAQSEKRVLLIDADIRKGYLHEIITHGDNSNGLSDYLSEQSTTEQIAKKTYIPNLYFVSRGSIAPNPSELLMGSRFAQLITWAKENFDLVIFDTPPILAVTDAAIIGRSAATTFLVTKFEENTTKEIELCIKRFEQNGVDVKGVILNGIIKRAANRYKYGYGYDYGYEYDKKK